MQPTEDKTQNKTNKQIKTETKDNTMTSLPVRRLLSLLPLLLLLVGSVESFVVGGQGHHGVTVTKLSLQQSGHEDHLIPNDIRVERSKNIREKLLGQDDDESDVGTTAVATNKKTTSKNKKTKDDGHAILSRLTELFDEHLLDMEDFDPNC